MNDLKGPMMFKTTLNQKFLTLRNRFFYENQNAVREKILVRLGICSFITFNL